MAFCNNCGVEVADGARFCPSCGTDLTVAGATAAARPVPTQQTPPPAGDGVGAASSRPPEPQQQAYQQAPPPPQGQAYQQAPPPPQGQAYQQAPPPPQGQAYQQAPPPPQGQAYQQAPPPPQGYVPTYGDWNQDWQANKVYGILAYIGFLVFVTIFAAPKTSHYSRWHANQGLVLFIVDIILWVVLAIVNNIAAAANPYGYVFGGGWVVGIIVGIVVWVFIVILVVLGIVNAVKGTQKPLPIIGGITILKPR
ncbi:MAG: zinc ribbon domain-containing protein [Clostridiales Family XIII bacterium]|jgi:uncharacterized membrane protein|nr:zinc ribbon domain-containing protein [Clostridiales Family XIII bacterium]